MADKQLLNPHLGSENPIQKINWDAARIEEKHRIAVVRCHVGDPKAPQHEPTNQVVAEYMLNRSADPNSRGYQKDVAGDIEVRNQIANAINVINRLDEKDHINYANVIGVTGGTGALNVGLTMFDHPVVLAPDPYYPPWNNISDITGTKLETYDMRAEDNYLLNFDLLDKRLEKASKDHPDQPLILLYHYPNNPSGKTLNEAEARQVAGTLSKLAAKYPKLHLLQEDLYLATTAPEMGLYTPLPYLSDEAKMKTIWLNSPSKMGHAQDRGAIICAYDKDLLDKARNAVSLKILGTSTPALMLTAETLKHIALGGVDAIDAPGSDPNNYRFTTAKYYQDRMKIVSKGLQHLERKLDTHILDATNEKTADSSEKTPKGTYYLFPDFKFLQGKKVPEELRQAVGKETFENGMDITNALLNAHEIGLRPVTVVPGTLFTKDPSTMRVRFATIEENQDKLFDAVNTVWGLAEKTLGVKLGAEFRTTEQLIADGAPEKPIPKSTKIDGVDHPGYFTREVMKVTPAQPGSNRGKQ
jgi:aspartate/methionine/tyrosine aminotransferase